MAIDTRLLIGSIPALEKATLYAFLSDMDNTEKGQQQQEQELLQKAQQERRPYDRRESVCFLAGMLSSLTLLCGFFNDYFDTKLGFPRSSKTIPAAIALTVVAICAFAGSIFYDRKAAKIKIPVFDTVRCNRLADRIQRIEAKTKAKDLGAGEMNQLNAALYGLKEVQNLLKA